MHHEDIKAALRKKGVSSADLARHLGLSQMTISHVIHGRSKSVRVANAIAQITGHSLHVLWPSRYEKPTKTNVAALLGTSSRKLAA